MLKKPHNLSLKINDFFTANRFALLYITIAAMLIRLFFFSYQSTDYTNFLHLWFEELKAEGGLAAIGRPVGDYMVSYIYIMALLTYLPIPDFISIKLVSCIGDIILAWYAMRLVSKASQSPALPKIAYTAVLFLPSVILNSSAWAQCDAIYTAALLACVYYFVESKPTKAMLAYGIAFIFKLQAIFLAPLLLLLLLKRRVKIKHFFIVPLIYLITIIPAFLAGRPFTQLVTIYFSQTKTYTALSSNAPNLYAWLKPESTTALTVIGVLITAAFIIFTIVFVIKKKFVLTPQFLIQFAFLSTVMLPFLLPRMHERYFYPAEILAVICILLFPKLRVPAVTVIICSLLVTCGFLFGFLYGSAAILSIPMLPAFVFILKQVLTPPKNLQLKTD